MKDVLEAIDRIERHTEHGRAEFDDDELVQTWVVHHIEIIGEACRALPEGFMEAHPEVPWGDIVGMRNILIHHYFGIDLSAVWSVVEQDLPMLKSRVAAILGELDQKS